MRTIRVSALRVLTSKSGVQDPHPPGPALLSLLPQPAVTSLFSQSPGCPDLGSSNPSKSPSSLTGPHHSTPTRVPSRPPMTCSHSPAHLHPVLPASSSRSAAPPLPSEQVSRTAGYRYRGMHFGRRNPFCGYWSFPLCATLVQSFLIARGVRVTIRGSRSYLVSELSTKNTVSPILYALVSVFLPGTRQISIGTTGDRMLVSRGNLITLHSAWQCECGQWEPSLGRHLLGTERQDVRAAGASEISQLPHFRNRPRKREVLIRASPSSPQVAALTPPVCVFGGEASGKDWG